MRIYADLMENPLFITLGLVVVFGVIVLGVILLKKYVKVFQNDEGPKSDKEIAAEEVNRVLTEVTDEETLRAMASAAKELEKDSEDGRPTDNEILEEEMARTTEEVLDEETVKAMQKYAEEHPEEAAYFNNQENEK